jgi:hypothetical protein
VLARAVAQVVSNLPPLTSAASVTTAKLSDCFRRRRLAPGWLPQLLTAIVGVSSAEPSLSSVQQSSAPLLAVGLAASPIAYHVRFVTVTTIIISAAIITVVVVGGLWHVLFVFFSVQHALRGCVRRLQHMGRLCVGQLRQKVDEHLALARPHRDDSSGPGVATLLLLAVHELRLTML